MIEVRIATKDDLPAMLAIYNDIILTTTAVWHSEPHTLPMRQEWFALKQEQGHPVFVAKSESEVVGFSTFGPFRPWHGYRFTVENSVYVAAAHRGKGIANLLLPPLIDSAKQLKLHAIVAGIESTNDVSIRLNRKFGFEEVAHFKQVGYKFDRWLDLTFMELVLS